MFRTIIAAVLILLQAGAVLAAESAPRNEEQKTLYAVGLIVARQLSVFNLNPAELEIVQRGIMDSVTGRKPELELSAYNEKVQELARSRRKAQGEKLASGNKDFLEQAAKEKGAVQTASGLIFQSITEGSGASPGASDTVKVNYRGRFPDGKEFDSSYKRDKPIEFKLDGVIKCWTEGLQKMKVGGKAKLVCPPAIAYGDAGFNDLILPCATLVFDVELLETIK
jgi:FKBP-type peptidyl-prolyl cis-trans isomerase FkpA